MNKLIVGLLLIFVLGFSNAQSRFDNAPSYEHAVEEMLATLKKDTNELINFKKLQQNNLNASAEKLTLTMDNLEKLSKEYRTMSLGGKVTELNQKVNEFNSRTEDYHSMKDAFLKEQNDSRSNQGHLNSVEMNNKMYSENKIYDDITQAYRSNVVRKIGSPSGWNSVSYASNPWFSRHLLKFGNGRQAYKNGLSVEVPSGYNVLWLRCAGQHWGNFYVTYEVNGRRHDLGSYTCGWRKLNEISPDGAAPDSNYDSHTWLPIPLTQSGTHIVHSNDYSDSWISGVGFGMNLWGHARNSAVAYHWAVNGGSKIKWNSHEWMNDNLAQVEHNFASRTLVVPVVSNGKDKLFYMVEHNNNWVGTMHTGLKVGGKEIERLRTSYNNPFATHFNSKLYDRYVAAFIPKELIPAGAHFLRIEINTSNQDIDFHFREAGTHDY
jgi:hypothetical protein